MFVVEMVLKFRHVFVLFVYAIWVTVLLHFERPKLVPKVITSDQHVYVFEACFLRHFVAMLVPKCSKMESLTSHLFGHFGTLAPQWGLRRPLGTILVAILVLAPPFGCHFGDILVPHASFREPF